MQYFFFSVMVILYSLDGTTLAHSNTNYSVPVMVSQPGCTVYVTLPITPCASDVVLVTNLLHGVEYLKTTWHAGADPDWWGLKLVQFLGPSLRKRIQNCKHKIRHESESDSPWRQAGIFVFGRYKVRIAVESLSILIEIPCGSPCQQKATAKIIISH
jgi:hypothetical protein